MNKSEYHEYLRSEAWQIRRKWKLEQAGYRCQVCNGEGQLHVHHRTYKRIGDERENDLTVLCKECHGRYHDKMDAPSRNIAHVVSGVLKRWDSAGLFATEEAERLFKGTQVCLQGDVIIYRFPPRSAAWNSSALVDLLTDFVAYELEQPLEWRLDDTEDAA